MVSDIYAEVKDVIDTHMDTLSNDVFTSPDDGAYGRWLESLVQSLLIVIRPEPTEGAFLGYGEYAEIGRSRRIVAETLVQLQSIRENWQIEQRVGGSSEAFRAADDIDGMVNALEFCRWILAPWRKRQ